MSKNMVSNIKLGLFVIVGLLFLILLLYMIGRNESMFGDYFRLKARFHNVQGLNSGNNIRFSGIQVGTVKKVKILNDTLIEVDLLIESKMKNYIHKNAIVSITTDGLMGNRVLDITPSKEPAALVEEDDILVTKKTVDMGDMLQTLAKTNNDVALIAAELKSTMQRINSSTAIWTLLNDNTLPENLRASLSNARAATAKANTMIHDLNQLVVDIKEGKGSLGALLTDTVFATNLNEAIIKFKTVGEDADKLALELNSLTKNIRNEIDNGKGPLNTLLKDSAMVRNLNRSIENIQKGTAGFNEVMEAMKHNFLLRGYFKKLEKQKAKSM